MMITKHKKENFSVVNRHFSLHVTTSACSAYLRRAINFQIEEIFNKPFMYDSLIRSITIGNCLMSVSADGIEIALCCLFALEAIQTMPSIDFMQND